MRYLGDYAVDATVQVPFTTNDGNGGRVAPNSAFENTDVRIYKNASATQRTGVSGVTMTSPFNSMVGVHWVTIDLSDNDDAGFYAAGNDYTVVLYPDETVDGESVSSILATFSIQNRYMRGTDNANTTKTGYSLSAAGNNAVADAYLDRSSGVETGVTPRQYMQRTGALIAGKISGARTGTEIFVGMDGVTARVTVTVDASGNRTEIVYV